MNTEKKQYYVNVWYSKEYIDETLGPFDTISRAKNECDPDFYDNADISFELTQSTEIGEIQPNTKWTKLK